MRLKRMAGYGHGKGSSRQGGNEIFDRGFVPAYVDRNQIHMTYAEHRPEQSYEGRAAIFFAVAENQSLRFAHLASRFKASEYSAPSPNSSYCWFHYPATRSGKNLIEAGLLLRIRILRHMKRNVLYMIIGALIVVVIGLGAYVLREETKPSGVELRIDESGIQLQEN